MNGDRSNMRGSASQTVGAAMLSIVAPFIILIAVFALGGIAPFGQNTLLCDRNSEWFELLRHWRTLLDSSGGLMYSFARGAGSDFYSQWADGLCSPFLLVISAMDIEALPQAFAIVTLVRAAFAGFFAFLLLRRLSGHTPLSAAAFAVAYASGSQFSLAFLAPQYADAAVFLPLAAAGIALLCEKGRATLFFCGACAYLICCGRLWPLLMLFSVAYFVWCQLVLGVREGLWARLGLFVASLAASVGAAIVTLLPCFTVNAELSSAITPVGEVDTTRFFDIPAALFAASFSTETAMPLLFCSAITVLMLPLYFFNSRLPLGERQVCALFLALLTVSMCVPVMCWLWLGFSVPTGTVTCCGSVFALFAHSAPVRLTAQPMRVKVSRVLLSWMICALLFLGTLLFGSVKFTLSSVIFIAAFLTMYAAITIIALSGRGISAGFCVVILVCVACECALGGTLTFRNAASELPLVTTAEITTEAREQHNLKSIVTGSEQNGPSSFFRIRGGEISGISRMDDHSRLTPKYRRILEVLGISGGSGYTPVTDALLGIKYTVNDSEGERYSGVGSTGRSTVYRNDALLGLCFSAPSHMQAMTTFSNNPFAAQNELVSAMAGAERKLFVEASLTGRGGNGVSVIDTPQGVEIVAGTEGRTAGFSVLIPTDGPLYMYLGSKDSTPVKLSVNGSELGEMDLSGICYIGRYARGAQVTVTIPVEGERMELGGTWFAVLDTALTDTAMAQLAQQNAAYITADGDKVTCTATISEGHVLMTTIPYQAGWKAYVNGKPAETLCLSGAMLGVDTGAGVCDVRLVYEPEDFTVCLIISAVFLLFGFVLTCVLDSDRLRRMYENSLLPPEPVMEPELPPQEDIFAAYSSYMIPDIPSLDDQEDDFSDYFNGM